MVNPDPGSRQASCGTKKNGFVDRTIYTRFSLPCLRLSIQTFLGYFSFMPDPGLGQVGPRDGQDLSSQELLLSGGKPSKEQLHII